MKKTPRAMTIAGSDSGGGAGIQADLKTFAALNVYGASAVTALTAQNTRGVTGIHAVPAAFVEQQIAAILDDIGADAVKTGMLANREIVESVVRAVDHYRIERLVVDPVIVSKHGDLLLTDDAVEAYIAELIPRALVVTPNAGEAARLVGFAVDSLDTQREAARAIAAMGPQFVIVKGGHIPNVRTATDILFDGKEFHALSGPRLRQHHTHGTGCTFSAAIAAYLALGQPAMAAFGRAKEFVARAIEHGLSVGQGVGPVNPMWAYRVQSQQENREDAVGLPL